MYDTLLSFNSITLEFEPGLAKAWTISDDKKTFTFYLDTRARWSDGTPITAEDVKWTFDAVMDPKNLTGVHKTSLAKFESAEIIDTFTVRLQAKEVHWGCLISAGSFHILPSKTFKNVDFNKINFEFPVISGPYRIGKLNEGISMTIERREDWWGWQQKSAEGLVNFQTIRFKFLEEQENAFEAFKKGQVDLFPVYTSRIWINETTGEKFEKNWVVKQKVYNHEPSGLQGFAMNMRKPPFDDVRVRKAMALLLNRDKMNKTLMYGQYFLHRSYWEDLYSEEIPCPNPFVAFDPESARKLLNEAGWKANPKTGILEKNGRPFSFRFLTNSSSTNKFLAIYSEDLKNVGIELVIDQKDYAAWSKDMDEFNYQMTWANWAGIIFKNPQGMWSSKEADVVGGNNITGFKNDQVDALIEKQKTIFDIKERNAICRQIDSIVYNEHPYALLWNSNSTRLLYWNKFGTPPWVLSIDDDERSAYGLWWADEDAEIDLETAIQENSALPQRPREVHFDRVFAPAQPAAMESQSLQ
jgi:microcin C transport system substrate-binding protein